MPDKNGESHFILLASGNNFDSEPIFIQESAKIPVKLPLWTIPVFFGRSTDDAAFDRN
jgi:hypothetical protein